MSHIVLLIIKNSDKTTSMSLFHNSNLFSTYYEDVDMVTTFGNYLNWAHYLFLVVIFDLSERKKHIWDIDT